LKRLKILSLIKMFHLIGTFNEHQNNVAEHNKHKQRQETSNKKISSLEQIVKKLESGLDGSIDKKAKEEIEKEIEKLGENLISKVI